MDNQSQPLTVNGRWCQTALGSLITTQLLTATVTAAVTCNAAVADTVNDIITRE